MDAFTEPPERPAGQTPTGRLSKAEINRRIDEIVAARDGSIGYDDLRDIGLQPRQIRNRVKSGELVVRTPLIIPTNGVPARLTRATVFTLGSARLSLDAARWRALQSAPSPAYLADLTTCALFGTIKPTSSLIHVMHPGGSWDAPRGVKSHRADKLRADEVTVRLGFPTATFARGVVDAAATAASETIDDILDEAVSINIYDEAAIKRAIDSRENFDGAQATLRAIGRLDAKSGEFRSKFERLTTRLVETSRRIPPPVVNVLLNGYRPDLYFPGTSAILECDGDDYHRSLAQRIADEERAEILRAMGFVIMPLRWKHVKYEGHLTLPRIEDFVLAHLEPPRGRHPLGLWLPERAA